MLSSVSLTTLCVLVCFACNAVEEHTATFQKDNMYTLILRLRHNVIKTALRMLNKSYSRISLADVAQKLGLDR